VKTQWEVDASALERSALEVASRASAQMGPVAAIGIETGDPIAQERRSLYGLLDLEVEERKLILDHSISDLPLHRALVLKAEIMSAPQAHRDHLLLALAWTLVTKAGNVRFGPEVGVTAPKWDVDVVGEWLAQVRRMAHDLSEVARLRHVPSALIHSDSRDVSGLADGSISAVFTSPPYPNEKDYTRTTRLESVILGLIRNREELRALKQGLLRSNTRNIYKADTDDDHVRDIPEIQRIAEAIEARRIEMGKNSGFERLYHRVATNYFGGMARHLESLKPKLAKEAVLGYVVGDQASYLQIHIKTGELLAQIAASQGYVVERIDLFRTRQATATRQQLREEVVVLRWPG
jgi:hypothetical protein